MESRKVRNIDIPVLPVRVNSHTTVELGWNEHNYRTNLGSRMPSSMLLDIVKKIFL